MKNAKVNANAIVFAQVKGNTKRVVATRNGEAVYVAHALLTANKPIWEGLDGTRVEGEKGLFIDFATAKTAKAFIAQAITEMSTKDYNKARKTEPKAKAEKKATVTAPTKAKGKKAVEYVTVHLADGTPLQVKASDLMPMDEPAKKPIVKGKGKVDLTKPTKANKGVKKGKGKVDLIKPTTAPNAKASKSVKAKAEPKKSKGNCKVDFSKLAGKGRAANKDAAALMRKAGLVDGTSAEYKTVWAEWCKVR